jgi:hypothetical protein
VTLAERLARPATAGLVWLAIFSALYTAGDVIGAWPELPEGAFLNVDLVVGLLAGVALLVSLGISNRRPTPDA